MSPVVIPFAYREITASSDPALMLRHHHRSERARPIPGDMDRDLADLGAHRLRRRPVPAIGRLLARTPPGLVAQLRFQRGLQHLPGQPGQQSVRAGQIDTLLARGNDQLIRDRRHIRRRWKQLSRSRIDQLAVIGCDCRFGVHRVTHLPARPTPHRSRRTPHTQTSRQTLREACRALDRRQIDAYDS